MQRLRWSKNRKKMAGLSAWEGFAFLFLVGGYFFIGMHLYEPVWARWKMMDIIETTMAEEETMQETRQVIASRILKRMSVNNIYGVTKEDFKIQKTDQTIRLTFDKVLVASMPFAIDLQVKAYRVIDVDRPLKYESNEQ